MKQPQENYWINFPKYFLKCTEFAITGETREQKTEQAGAAVMLQPYKLVTARQPFVFLTHQHLVIHMMGLIVALNGSFYLHTALTWTCPRSLDSSSRSDQVLAA